MGRVGTRVESIILQAVSNIGVHASEEVGSLNAVLAIREPLLRQRMYGYKRNDMERSNVRHLPVFHSGGRIIKDP